MVETPEFKRQSQDLNKGMSAAGPSGTLDNESLLG